MDLSGCILYEITVMRSEGWRDFVWNFQHSISEDGYPIELQKVFDALAEGRGGKALLHLDIAFSNLTQIVTKTGDTQRGRSYAYLLLRLRNKIWGCPR